MQQKERLFNDVVREHHASIFRLCQAYIYDKSQAEDLCQEVLLQIWISLERFKGQAKISTWIYRIAVNTAISYNTKDKKGKHAYLPEKLELPAEETGSLLQHEKEHQLKKLKLCISKLEDQDRIIISMVLENISYKDIAEIIGSNTNNVGVKIGRIKSRLLKMMENTGAYEL